MSELKLSVKFESNCYGVPLGTPRLQNKVEVNIKATELKHIREYLMYLNFCQLSSSEIPEQEIEDSLVLLSNRLFRKLLRYYNGENLTETVHDNLVITVGEESFSLFVEVSGEE